QQNSLAFKEQPANAGTKREFHFSDTSLAFADPFEMDLWKLVKWTVVTLIVAGTATYCLRFKYQRTPFCSSEREGFQVTESLKLDARTTLHMIRLRQERYLVATDLTGVKSVTLIPDWNLEN